MHEVLRDRIPADHSRQMSIDEYVNAVIGGRDGPLTILDLGCGAGDLVRAINGAYSQAVCIGLDIPDSPEVRERKKGGNFVTFDGVRVPFASSSFDFVVSRQVLEHVERPEELLSEVARVLKPGGQFFGSTSHLEPFHSYSTWNYTPYGLCKLAQRAGLEAVEFRPGTDAITMIARRVVRRRGLFDRWLRSESPLNRFISLVGRLRRWDHSRINAIKLQLAGQFYFVMVRR